VKVVIPQAPDLTIRRIFAAVQAGFERIKEYAVLPPGGAAGSVLVKSDARNYDSTWESRADTAANIASKTAAINTTGKYQGRCVFDTTNTRLMVANGPAATDLWYRADGAVSVTPA
jgi:hypothetical protein